MPYKKPEFRDAPQPITVQRALYLIAEQELARKLAQLDFERVGAALVQDL
jgi:hypothetical protein